MAERKGIEIDFCPECRGVWLDRGELDKLLEKAAEEEAAKHSAPQKEYESHSSRSEHYDNKHTKHHREYDHKKKYHGYKKRHKSWLMELFD